MTIRLRRSSGTFIPSSVPATSRIAWNGPSPTKKPRLRRRANPGRQGTARPTYRNSAGSLRCRLETIASRGTVGAIGRTIPDHIGRLSGTATPDSAKWTSPSSLGLTPSISIPLNTTATGPCWPKRRPRIGLTFKPDARNHVRAGTAPNGERRLVVNSIAARPATLSSGVIPDHTSRSPRGKAAEVIFAVARPGSVEHSED